MPRKLFSPLKKRIDFWLDAGRPCLEYLGFGQRRCAHCREPFFGGELINPDSLTSLRLCPMCQKLLAPYDGIRCGLCGLPAGCAMPFQPEDPANPHLNICKACSQEPPNWTRVAYYGIYAGLLRDLLLRFKFDGELSLGRLLGEFLLQASCALPKPDIIIPVPQHPGHLAKRGYNQALELARELARLSGIPFHKNLLMRVKPGIPQEHLGAAQRKENLRNAFRASSRINGKHVWLLDDVMTTGSTSHFACEALSASGCREVSVLFVARTSL